MKSRHGTRDVKRRLLHGILFALCATAGGLQAEESTESGEAPATNSPDAPKALSGMSILGNSEAPKSLVIVPWKTSEIGDGIGVSNLLDGRARPVDRDVFLRELDYYQLRTSASGSGRNGSEALVSSGSRSDL